MKSLEIKISSVLNNIEKVQNLIKDIGNKLNLNEEIDTDIEVSVSELIKNAIIHGNQSDESKYVHLIVEVKEKYIQIIIEDEGNGFDYQNIPDPTSSEDLDKDGGRGIHITKELAEKLEFSKGGRKVELIFPIYECKSLISVDEM